MPDTSINPIILCVPKGRILEELRPIFDKTGLRPEAAFYDDSSRKLRFTTNHAEIDLIKVRAFDVASFVAYGGAQMGIAGSDVMEEFDYEELYAPVDLEIGRCRLSVAVPREDEATDFKKFSHIRVATKYPASTARHFARAGIQAECVKLGGAMEIAPALGMASCIVDLVSSGQTLKENNLREAEIISRISSRLIVNRSAFKTDQGRIQGWIQKFADAAVKQAD